MDFLDGLGIILAVLAGGASGVLLTVWHYHRVEKDHAAYEEEAARYQDILAGLALLRRMQTDQHGTPRP